MFWTNFYYLCTSVGKSPNAVGKELGKASGTISAWKKGILPRQNAIKEVADYFDVSVTDLTSVDLSKKKKPTLTDENELDNSLALDLKGLSRDELAQVHAFVAGLKASRML